MIEVFRALGSLAEIPSAQHQELCSLLELDNSPTKSEHSETFVFELYPYSSIYLGPEGKLGGEARDRIAGFWRALGLTPPAEPDHLTVLLSFYAEIREHELQAQNNLEQERWEHIRASFLWEHLLSWLPIYLLRMSDARSPFFRKWGDLLSEALQEEAHTALGEVSLSAHLRQALPIADPRDGEPKEFLESLLAPVRSGFILLRSDLIRAGLELSLATRIGERRFVLETFLSQAPTELLIWLAEFAGTTSERYRTVRTSYPGIMKFWIDQAERTRTLLLDLADSSDTNPSLDQPPIP